MEQVLFILLQHLVKMIKNVAEKYDLPYLNPVKEDGTYKEGLWKGKLVFDADLDVIKYLKENDKLFKKQKMVHNYPHC